MQENIDKKLIQIIDHPESFKPLKRPLQGYRRAHSGPYIVTYRLYGKDIRFIRLAHHDRIYRLPHD